MSYESDMYIDESALDVELLGQASLMAKYTRMTAQAQLDRDLAKEDLELTRAKLDLAIRDDPESYGLGKVTETAINNVILINDDYRAKLKDYHDANFEYNALQGTVRSIDHKKSALENLVRLYGLDYIAGPSVPRDLTEARKIRAEEMDHRIGSSLRRTTKPKNI